MIASVFEAMKSPTIESASDQIVGSSSSGATLASLPSRAHLRHPITVPVESGLIGRDSLSWPQEDGLRWLHLRGGGVSF